MQKRFSTEELDEIKLAYRNMHLKRFGEEFNKSEEGRAYAFTVTFKNVNRTQNLPRGVSVTAPSKFVRSYLDKDKVVVDGTYDANAKQPTISQFEKAITKLTDDLKKFCPVGVVGAETGKYGRRHVHLVVRCSDENKLRLLNRMWQHNSTFGKVIMSREIKSVRAVVRYIVKYASKDYVRNMYSTEVPKEWSW
tara:strand:- start:113 stop:691 length:579 start_codon:yes stop_codon:yes gene_type:complete